MVSAVKKRRNTGGTGFRVEGGDKLSFRYTEYEIFTEHQVEHTRQLDMDLDTQRERDCFEIKIFRKNSLYTVGVYEVTRRQLKK